MRRWISSSAMLAVCATVRYVCRRSLPHFASVLRSSLCSTRCPLSLSAEGIRPNERRSHRIDTWPVTPGAFSKGRRCSLLSPAVSVVLASRDCLATCSAQTQVSLDPLPKQSLLQEDEAPVATARKGGASRNQSTIDRFENSTAWSGRLP